MVALLVSFQLVDPVGRPRPIKPALPTMLGLKTWISWVSRFSPANLTGLIIQPSLSLLTATENPPWTMAKQVSLHCQPHVSHQSGSNETRLSFLPLARFTTRGDVLLSQAVLAEDGSAFLAKVVDKFQRNELNLLHRETLFSSHASCVRMIKREHSRPARPPKPRPKNV